MCTVFHRNIKICVRNAQNKYCPVKFFITVDICLILTPKTVVKAAILEFWWATWIDNRYFLTLYSTYANDYLYQFWCFYHKVNDRLFFHQLTAL